MISIIFLLLSGLTVQNSSSEYYLPEETEIFTEGVDIIYNEPIIWLLSPMMDLFKNERALGLEQLEVSCTKGLFSERATKHALLRIYLEEKWYDKFFSLLSTR